MNSSMFAHSQAVELVNARLRELYPDDEELFDIVLMTNNHAQVGVRLINSINHYGEFGGLSSCPSGCAATLVMCLTVVPPQHKRRLGFLHLCAESCGISGTQQRLG